MSDDDIMTQVQEYIGGEYVAPQKVYVRKPIRTRAYTLEDFFVTEESIVECGTEYCNMITDVLSHQEEVALEDMQVLEEKVPAYMRKQERVDYTKPTFSLVYAHTITNEVVEYNFNNVA